MSIPDEVMCAPASGKLLQCLHEIASVPEGTWRAYEDAAATDYPLAQRRGDRVWITQQDGGVKELRMQDVRAICPCEPGA